MTDEILKGYITNDRFVWKANKGACKKCTSMDNKMFVNKKRHSTKTSSEL